MRTNLILYLYAISFYTISKSKGIPEIGTQSEKGKVTESSLYLAVTKKARVNFPPSLKDKSIGYF